jgi:DNA-binding response OmpR family regulator
MRHIWTVDDDEEMSRAIGLMLQMLECDVTIFNNVRSAAQCSPPAGNPTCLSWISTCRKYRGWTWWNSCAATRWKDLPIVMLSSEAGDTMVDKALELGADTYVMKPVTIEELDKAMAAAFIII